MAGFVLDSDPEDFAARVHDFLHTDPVLHTLPLTVLEAVRAGRYPEWVLSRVEDERGDVLAVGVRTPPYAQIIAASDRTALRELAHGLASSDQELTGAVGMVPWVHEFASDWAALTGVRVEEDKAERLFRLDELTPPRPAPGVARLATTDDVDRLVTWFEAFRDEAGMPRPIDARGSVSAAIADGRRFLWEVDDVPVCDVGHTPVVGGQLRIGPVYTPPEQRGRGYASSLTAHVTRLALDAGHVPTLFTDLANPTSNGIYRALGYRPVADASMLAFSG